MPVTTFSILSKHISLMGLALAFLFTCSLSFAADYSPQILSPRLSYLDTNVGLSQDTVETLLIDSEGFLWIGTDEGLDRFDGQNTLQVPGTAGLLNNNPVFHLFEYDERYIILSTGHSGIVKFDKYSGETEVLLARGYRFDNNWPQYSDVIIKEGNGAIVVALNEEIYRLDLTTNEPELLLSLSDEQIQQGESIRALYIYSGTYFIGTTANLWAFDPISKMLHRLNHTDNESANARNVKNLFSPNGGKLWVGTVEGLYEIDLPELMGHIYTNWAAPAIKVIDPARNIWAIEYVSSENIYVGTDIGLFKGSVESGELEYLFALNKQYEVLSHPDVMDIEVDGIGNIWMGTFNSGAIHWSPSSLLFKNVYAASYNEASLQLSNNVVTSVHQHSSDSLWLGTNNGLNHYHVETGLIEQFLVNDIGNPSYSESDILQIDAASADSLWVLNGNGLSEFNIESGAVLSNTRFGEEIDLLFSSDVFSFFAQNRELIWISNPQGIFKINLREQKVADIKFDDEQGQNANSFMVLLGMDIRSNQMLVSKNAAVWGINPENLSSRLLHSAMNQGANISTRASSWLRDTNNNVWVSYLGIGLFKLNGTDFSQAKFYNRSNRLPTNIVYGLALDAQGDIWFSSHSGIHAFNPEQETVQSFGFVNGLSSSEFNEGASEVLADGRLIYAGNLGFTAFNPMQLKSHYTNKLGAPIITEIALASRTLQLPFTNLDGQSIVLEPDDMGLTLKYSMLNFEQSHSNRYQYRIIDGGRVTRYPSVTSSEILIPALAPGDYVIEILNANFDDVDAAKASIYLKVKYPAHVSPGAILFYIVVFLLLTSIYMWRRHKTQRVIFEANRKVAEYNSRLTSALRASNADIWEWQSDINTLSGTRLIAELGLIYESIDFHEYAELIVPQDRQNYLKSWERFTLSGTENQLDVTYRIKGAQGQTLWYRDVGSLKFLQNGEKAVSGTYTNLTETLAAKEKLKVFGEAFNHTRDWVLIIDKNSKPIAANPSFMQAFGIDSRRPLSRQIKRINKEYESELALLLNQMSSLKASERWKTEANVIIKKNPMTLLADIKAIPQHDNQLEIDYYLCIFTDITDQILAQKELQKLASYDVLTGLINRTLLIERIKQAIHYSKRHLDKLAVLFIDLDRFKPINDSFGHDSGDKVLIEIGNRLSAKFRGQDSVARIGGDEFVVVLNEIKDKEALASMTQEILKLIAKPISLGFQNVNVSASIGIAIYPDHAADAENLVRNADIAMYSAKSKGRNNAEYFINAMNDQAHANMLLENRIKAAVEKREYINFYQPIVDLSTGKTAGFELLLRWFDEGKAISPNVFIPLAEQIGCILEMTDIAIERALEDMAQWQHKGFDGYVAINLSAKHFNQTFKPSTILGLLNKHNLPASCLRFEITENLLMENSEISIQYMNDLRGLGFKISLDDFGTGYSSLRYLKDFPIDVLKLDKSFVDDVTEDGSTQSIIYSTLVMAELLDLDTVAEGIETEEQLAYFKGSKCKLVQGFYFSKPIGFEKTFGMLDKIWFDPTLNVPKNVFDMKLKNKK
ncbi:EAL domain-containing protein [Glaciecola sp. SC05]|uniref:EAL domain-containing protein n=1 Tax=Glaciecola sp. SC05 TaxID=1987355 RepID=UPI0035292757